MALKTRRPTVLGLSPLCWPSRSSVGFFDEAIPRIHSTNSITHHPGHNGSQLLAVGHGYADNPTRHRLHCLDRNWINRSIYRRRYNAGRADQRNKDLCGRTHCVQPDFAEAIKSLSSRPKRILVLLTKSLIPDSTIRESPLSPQEVAQIELRLTRRTKGYIFKLIIFCTDTLITSQNSAIPIQFHEMPLIPQHHSTTMFYIYHKLDFRG